MGKKLKLSLDDLKITSFVTSINGIRGGLYPTETCGCGAGGGGTIGDDDDPIATITCQTAGNCITNGMQTNTCHTVGDGGTGCNPPPPESGGAACFCS